MRGLYTALTAMSVGQAKLEVTANNLANIRTSGYRRDRVMEESFREMLIFSASDGNFPGLTPRGTLAHGVAVSEIVPSNKQGSLLETGNPLDLALSGEGYFAVETPAGMRFTRNGSFRVDDQGLLTTQQGFLVLGEDGPLQAGENAVVDEQGNIYIGAELLGRLLLVALPPEAPKEGNGLYALPEGEDVIPAEPEVHQGFLEESNVDLAQEMADLIRIRRGYEAARGLIETYDKFLSRGVNEIAGLR